MPHTLLITLLFISFLIVAILIAKRWVIPARGFTQLGLFTLGEITFTCNKGVLCSNCPFSFGICPIGTVQRLSFIKSFPFYFTAASIIVTGLVLGTLSCGWACPVGFIQDVLRSCGLSEVKIPNKFKIFRYFTLFLAVLLLFMELRFHFFSSRGIELFNGFVIIGGAILLTMALFIKRPFCRLLCPLGLIYGKLNKLSPIKAVLNLKECVACGKCSKVCINDINPVKEINGDLCAKCFNCVKVCPQRLGREK